MPLRALDGAAAPARLPVTLAVTLADIRAAALAGGMVLMREDGQRLVDAGITSREELLRVTRD